MTNLKQFITEGTPEAIIKRYESLPKQAANSKYGEFDSNIVVLDTETTGLSFNHDELIQIAAARVEEGKITDWYVTFVNPGTSIPDDIVHLTNISDKDVKGAPTPEEALAGLVEFVGDSKVVAHNAAFDKTFTTKHPEGYPLLQNVWVDSLDLARIALPRLKSHRLTDLVKAFGAPTSTHRADADVEATCAILRVLLAAVDAMPKPLVAKIASLASAKKWPTQVVFEYFTNLECEAMVKAGKGVEETNAPSDTTKKSETSKGKNKGSVGEGEDADDGSQEVLTPQQRCRFELLEEYSLVELRKKRVPELLKEEEEEEEEGEEEDKEESKDTEQKKPRKLEFPEEKIILDAFTPNGLVGSLYENYEQRDEQRQMSVGIQRAMATNTNLVVEAGTGVGKSMAYLVPLALTARKNGITVGVATKTNALLDQLLYHEAPALAAAIAKRYPDDEPLSCVALKGCAHYACLRKIYGTTLAGARTVEVQGKPQSQAPAMAGLLSFIEQTVYDDMDNLKIDYRVLQRAAITSSSQECLRGKCPFYRNGCFVHGLRKMAHDADIVLTNHTMLFCDIIADGGLLPKSPFWVVDEAHNTESEARDAFASEIDAREILYVTRKLDKSRNNIFKRARKIPEPSELLYSITGKGISAGRAYCGVAEEFCKSLKTLLCFDPSSKRSGYEFVDVWVNSRVGTSNKFKAVAKLASKMSHTAERVVRLCKDLLSHLEQVPGTDAIQGEVSAVSIELKQQISAIDLFFKHPNEKYVYAAELSRKKESFVDKLSAKPIDVGPFLNSTFYSKTASVMYTSATLSINNSFDAFTEAVGLGSGKQSRFKELQINSSYDYDKNMTIYVAKDMPEPNSIKYLDELQKFLIKAHVAQDGSMLTLFTNRREMEGCFNVVRACLQDMDLRLVCQKWGVSTKGLKDDFIADKHLSLFALKSFWEGFDAPGSTLRGVMIPKLPFSSPNDPLSCERDLLDNNSWRRYSLPAAVIEVKQAVGRLIRNSTDKGAVIFADCRLVKKRYGIDFLNSLPSKTVKIMPMDEIVKELERNK